MALGGDLGGLKVEVTADTPEATAKLEKITACPTTEPPPAIQ
jgi:hypothetical protein